MANKKGFYMLTSAGFKNPETLEKVSAHFRGLTNIYAYIITTAAKDKERNPFVIKNADLLKKISGISVVFVDIEKQPTFNLSNANIIFIAGGNTFTLMKYVLSSDLPRWLENCVNDGGIVVGASAGALVLGPSIKIATEVTPDDNIEHMSDFRGLNLVKETIYPHYSEEIESAIKSFEKKYSLNVKRLTNDEYFVVYP